MSQEDGSSYEKNSQHCSSPFHRLCRIFTTSGHDRNFFLAIYKPWSKPIQDRRQDRHRHDQTGRHVERQHRAQVEVHPEVGGEQDQEAGDDHHGIKKDRLA